MSPVDAPRTLPRRRFAATSASVIAVALLALSGCSAANESSSDAGGGFVGQPAPDMPVNNGGASGGDGDFGGEEGAPTAPGDGRSVITTGWMYVTVDDPLEAAADAARIAERAGGRVDGRTEYAPNDNDAGGAELVLRIPSDDLQPTIDELKELGELEELSLSANDVTREVQDLDARITALDASLTRLLALLEQAENIDDLIALEATVSDRQGQLESLEAQRRSLGEQVALSTLTLTLGSEDVAPPSDPDSFVDGLRQGWDALVAFASGALVIAGVLLPWLLVLAVIGGIVWLSVRAARRRRGQRAPAEAGAQPPAP
ncbi:uncharacterized protein DUF4349 [Microcella putealis]|uniref:Uncharacterized protein DUF4349 n=1 Tax=Microcella putealis TaxID=337005 RepID=A0A4Q7LYB5_9MICO|nr:DUF4349 domain-containing protein [Microcella putealis]RZS59681.1 uncharacterized protein DUF4349 [Microcella putealis]TQM26794.1 uncharacterized protein DUF4349 [Microcella putealis]